MSGNVLQESFGLGLSKIHQSDDEVTGHGEFRKTAMRDTDFQLVADGEGHVHIVLVGQIPKHFEPRLDLPVDPLPNRLDFLSDLLEMGTMLDNDVVISEDFVDELE